jgi:hypothetical protein
VIEAALKRVRRSREVREAGARASRMIPRPEADTSEH